MRKGLTRTGQIIYGVTMLVGVLVELGLVVWLFATGRAAIAIGLLVFGSFLIPSVFHLIGMALAAPFLVAGERKANRGRFR